MVQAIIDRRERIAALERIIVAQRQLILDHRHEGAARRVILAAERELRRLKGH